MKIDSKVLMRNKVSRAWIDTDVIIRLLTSDDPHKQKASAMLFEKAEKGLLVLSASITVIADSVYVLSSRRLYAIPRMTIRELLTRLIQIANFKVENKQLVLKALDLYAATRIDFGDAYLAVNTLRSTEKTIYSYDHDFDHIAGIRRIEP